MTDKPWLDTLTGYRPQQHIGDEWAEMTRPLPLWADPQQHRTAPLPIADLGVAGRFGGRMARYFYDDPMRLRGAVSAAADPLNIPSALLGTVSPRMRDTWRSYQKSDPVASITGDVAGGFGLMKALPQIAGKARGLLAGGLLGASSDVIDTASDTARRDPRTPAHFTNYIEMNPLAPGRGDARSTGEKALWGTMLFPARRLPF